MLCFASLPPNGVYIQWILAFKLQRCLIERTNSKAIYGSLLIINCNGWWHSLISKIRIRINYVPFVFIIHLADKWCFTAWGWRPRISNWVNNYIMRSESWSLSFRPHVLYPVVKAIVFLEIIVIAFFFEYFWQSQIFILIKTLLYNRLEWLSLVETKINVQLLNILAILQIHASVWKFDALNFNTDFFYLRHLIQAFWKHFRTVKRCNILTDKTKSGHIFIVNTIFPTNFENLGAVDWMSKL